MPSTSTQKVGLRNGGNTSVHKWCREAAYDLHPKKVLASRTNNWKNCRHPEKVILFYTFISGSHVSELLWVDSYKCAAITTKPSTSLSESLAEPLLLQHTHPEGLLLSCQMPVTVERLSGTACPPSGLVDGCVFALLYIFFCLTIFIFNLLLDS